MTHEFMAPMRPSCSWPIVHQIVVQVGAVGHKDAGHGATDQRCDRGAGASSRLKLELVALAPEHGPRLLGDDGSMRCRMSSDTRGRPSSKRSPFHRGVSWMMSSRLLNFIQSSPRKIGHHNGCIYQSVPDRTRIVRIGLILADFF